MKTIEDIKWLFNNYEVKVIPFWKVNEKPYGVFCQWYQSENQITETDDNASIYFFSCMEQYMMWHKAMLFGDNEVADMILKETVPAEMKKYGRLVKNFDPDKWDKEKYNIVYQGNLLKFAQNPDLKEVLLSTMDDILCEAAFYDKVWGIGLGCNNNYIKVIDPNKWPSDCQNLLGIALMDVREHLR